MGDAESIANDNHADRGASEGRCEAAGVAISAINLKRV